MIVGAHAIIYSTDADKDRAFLKDVLGLPHVDAGHGWLIFGLPPAEVAVHPGRNNDVQELYLMVEDVAAFVREMKKRRVECFPVVKQSWGLLTGMTLPGGSKVGVYQPLHDRPSSMVPAAKAKGSPKKTVKASPKKAAPKKKSAAAPAAARRKRT